MTKKQMKIPKKVLEHLTFTFQMAESISDEYLAKEDFARSAYWQGYALGVKYAIEVMRHGEKTKAKKRK